MSRKIYSAIVCSIMILSGFGILNATSYDVSSGTVNITAPGSHTITGSSTSNNIYISNPSDQSNAVYNITLNNLSVVMGPWASAIDISNAASTAMTVNFIVVGNNTVSAYNHGGIEVVGGTANVVFTTTDYGQISVTSSYSGYFAFFNSGGTTNPSIDPSVYCYSTIAGNPAANASALSLGFTQKPLVMKLSSKAAHTALTGSVTTSSAVVGGEIVDNFGTNYTERGVVYSATDFTPQIGSAGVTKLAIGSGLGSFSATLSGLTPATTYYVRAYGITNSVETYGDINIFGTQACINPTSGGTISGDESNCGSYDPANITSVSLPGGYTGTPEYKWQSSTLSSSGGFSDIASSNSPTYNPGTISQTTYYKRLARVNCMADWSGAAESNVATKTVLVRPTPALSGSWTADEGSTGNVYTTDPGKTNYSWSVTGGTITSGGTSASNTATVTWNTPGNQSISINYADDNGCSASASTSHTVTVKPKTVYVSANNNSGTSGWGVTRFNDLPTALASASAGATVHVSNYSFAGTLDADLNTYIIDAGDFTVNGSITATTGRITAISTGYLALNPAINTPITYPLTDGTNDYTVRVTCGNAPTLPVKIKINKNKNAAGKESVDFWDISGQSNLNAVLVFRIPKSMLKAGQWLDSNQFRLYNGSRYLPIDREKLSVTNYSNYVEVTIGGLYSF